MKASNKIIGRLIVGCAFACCLTSNVRAQTAIPLGRASSNITLPSVSTSGVDPMWEVIEATAPIPADLLPGDETELTFYSAQNPDWPPLPGNIGGLPAWPLGGNRYLLDDLDVNYAETAQQAAARQGLAQAAGVMLMDSARQNSHRGL